MASEGSTFWVSIIDFVVNADLIRILLSYRPCYGVYSCAMLLASPVSFIGQFSPPPLPSPPNLIPSKHFTNTAYACQAPHNALSHLIWRSYRCVTNCVVDAVSSTTHKFLVHIALCSIVHQLCVLLAPMPAYELIEMLIIQGQSMVCTLWKYC